MNYMMGQMGPNSMGPGPPGPQNMRFNPQMGGNPRMGGRGNGFQSIPPSGPMMRQQPPMMGNGDMQRMRFPSNPNMMGPGGPMPNGPQKVPVSHPSPQPHAGSPWSNNMGSPNPNGMQMQQQSVGSPRTPGMYKNRPRIDIEVNKIGKIDKILNDYTFKKVFSIFTFLGDQNHGSPMMQQSMRSQTPVMSVPNNPGMGQPRMGGPQGNVSSQNLGAKILFI